MYGYAIQARKLASSFLEVYMNKFVYLCFCYILSDAGGAVLECPGLGAKAFTG